MISSSSYQDAGETDSLCVKQAKIIVIKKKSEGTDFRNFIRVLNNAENKVN